MTAWGRAWVGSLAAPWPAVGLWAQEKHGNAEAATLQNSVASSPVSNLIDAEWTHGSGDGEIFQVIQNGVPPTMITEAFGLRAPNADIWNVVNFLRSTAPK